MDFSTLNWIAIIISALVFFGLGAVWYNPAVFGTMWMQETGNTKEKAKSANMPKMMGLTMLFSFVMALNLALFMNSPEIGASQGAMYGFFTGLGWISCQFLFRVSTNSEAQGICLLIPGIML